MDITISGRHLSITEAMKEYARKKASKLERFFDRIRKIQVTLDVEGERQTAEMIVSATRGSTLIAEVAATDMYAAIDLAVDKLERQLTRHKEKLYNKRNRKKGLIQEIEGGIEPIEPMASDIT
ncbi:MAG TPA: ribosome hibernation-promoting factor, HPF/YfiA family [Candidatus Brocadiia bacterium]|nr:ribosome-associated translation inhibitor RaiA [Planctomycetota bacterium]MDO8094096.1 ribosome-associated translation inhibitor RaiA [Candidatus Brocadiales bacterium]